MTGLANRSGSRLSGFEFRAMSFGLTRNPEPETRNCFSIIAAGERDSVNNFYQFSKGRPGF
jgi:hypothetical protein